jgi:flagellar FliJ protein
MTQSLHTLLEHAERQRDESMASLLQVEDAARRLREQSAQLHVYRDEYRQRHPALGGRSTSIDILRTHQAFMQRLDQALGQLHGQIENAEARAARLRAELLARETRVASVRKLLERRGQEAHRVATRQDQRRSDDAAPSPLWRGAAGRLPVLL